jgi:hypothetical protein
MKVIVKKGDKITFERDLDFSYGDIVKVTNAGHCLSFNSVFNCFGVENPICKEVGVYDYPEDYAYEKEWKVIDFCANFDFTIDILLKNRFNSYIIYEISSPGSDKEIVPIRKSKTEHKKVIELVSKH